ncbi:MAG: hypothetical protein ACTHM1_12065 [Solirubrobacteraceae bacterium]
MLIIYATDPSASPQEDKSSQETAETGILDLLTGSDDHRPWSLEDLIREYDDKLTVEDAVDNLKRTGLIHRHADVVFPSRAAVRFAQIKW